jgi:signal transduction histidine kinase
VSDRSKRSSHRRSDPGSEGSERVRSRSTIRFRLTLLYSSIFLLCGAVLLLVGFVLVRTSLIREEGNTERVTESFGYTEAQVKAFNEVPLPPAPGHQPTTIGSVILNTQQEIRNDALHRLVVGSSIALGVLLLVSVVVGWLAAGRALSPVGKLTARAQAMSEDNLTERLNLEGPPDELKQLADTLDGMLARLDVAFTAQRRFAASVSHELRTPLAIMRGEADLALCDPDANVRELRLAAAIRDNVARTEALLESLLTLSRSESTMNESAVVDLAELTGDVVSQRVEAADSAKVHVDLELGSAEVEGDPWLLERLVANLVDNAINHNVEGGWLRVCVSTVEGHSVVEVSNTGSRLTPVEVEGILQPFHRMADHRPGYGLGMTIVQSVAKAHGGSVGVEPRPGGGLDVTVDLPGHVAALPVAT